MRTFLLAWLLALPLLAVSPAMAADSGRNLFLGQSEDEILPPDEAFKLKLVAQDPTTIRADFDIAPGHYLYRDRIKFEPENGNTPFAIANVVLPEGKLKQDQFFGESQVFYDNASALLTLAYTGAAPRQVTLSATYQGCSEKGLCYSPIKKTLVVDIPEGSITSTTSGSASALFSTGNDPAANLLKNGKPWLIVSGFFGFGLLLSLTPCVLPMIPILSSIIVGRRHFGKLHTFNLSLVYTLGMATSYALVGIAAGLTGRLLSNALQTPWALGFAALVFILLAFSMFGFYEISLPNSLENRLVNFSNRIKGGRFIGVFVMGALASLIVSPCVAAPLAGALLYISQTQDVVLGGTALFALAMGMGVPLLLIGASAGTLLPKTGPWMTAIRNFFGVVMLGMAIWLISSLIPIAITMALWAALLIVTAIYMHALDGLPSHAGAVAKFWKGIGVIVLIFGISLLIGAFSGAKSPLQPLAGLSSNMNTSLVEAETLPFRRVKTLQEVEDIVAQAKKPVMLDFYADWCVACKELEAYTFSDVNVQHALKGFVLLQADVTANDDADLQLLKHFGLFGPPGILFFDSQEQEMPRARIIGFQNAETFLDSLNKLDIK